MVIELKLFIINSFPVRTKSGGGVASQLINHFHIDNRDNGCETVFIQLFCSVLLFLYLVYWRSFFLRHYYLYIDRIDRYTYYIILCILFIGILFGSNITKYHSQLHSNNMTFSFKNT